ncbi:MAG: P-loop NTPase [Armatimonadota bacterium]|nr:P-loop NTPase [Armatimonadota bacterium]MCX7777092.1 P-loop NTPase [Armatimonadota bacterium]MDW8025139.1 P-loop NTPase [Armatimonadota bacterium]
MIKLKFAISGKGGVGKTTIAAALSRMLASYGYTVYAVDADPDANLGMALGFPPEEVDQIAPIAELKELIIERTGGVGPYFVLNPRVDDILEKFVVVREGIKLMRMGMVKKAASECYCRENTFLRAVIQGLLLERDEVVIMDMTAGIEHLTRGTAMYVDGMLIVTEPTAASMRTALTACALAHELGIKEVAIVGNKVRNDEEANAIASFVEAECSKLKRQVQLLCFIPFDVNIWGQAITGVPPLDEVDASPFWSAIRCICDWLISIAKN